jgi:hypothetical protein
MSYNLCISCNNEQGYYILFNDTSNKYGFINCYNQSPIGYYLDTNDSIYKPFSNYLNTDIYFYYQNLNNSKYSYEINSDINELKKIYSNIALIDLSQESKNIIREKFNLDKENYKIYLFINDYISNNSKLATSDYELRLFLENGSEIDLSKIDDDLHAIIYVPIKNLNLANFNYSEYFYEQGYDIYDKNSNFYNDSCAKAHLYENDITLEDRKKDIYPNNVTLCKENCEYRGININTKNIICECNLNINRNYSERNEDNYFLFNETGNLFDYLLDNINYGLFKCFKLLFNCQNLEKNISFYSMIIISFILLIMNTKFYTFNLSKLKLLLN